MGIPLGLVISMLTNYILISNIFSKAVLKIRIHPIIILATIVVVTIAVFISSGLSSRIACRISPLEAINYNEGKTTIGRKNTKSEKMVNLSRLSKINLTRNKKRTIVTILSITMSLILFIIILWQDIVIIYLLNM